MFIELRKNNAYQPNTFVVQLKKQREIGKVVN